MASSDDPSLAAALARTAKSYDETPYVHGPMMRSHPGRLAAQAVWRGLDAPEAARARVLEIGCACGDNILALAAAMPQASFLGVDLSPVQIATGEARRQRYGVQNVTLRAASFESLSDADGAFDFIICHGVYSWIPEPLRDSLFDVVRARLAPDGLAMVSFNVLPGWRLMQIARDSMLLNARLLDDPAERAQATRDLFKTLAAESANEHTYGKFWRDEAVHMAGGGDAYLAHEIFEDSNAPETFADFCARAARFGLDYLCETVGVNSEDDLAPEGADSIRRLAGGDRLKRETYIDIFSGRTFREALLVHKGRADAATPEPNPETLARLNFIPALDLTLGHGRERADVFRLATKTAEIVVQGAELDRPLRRLMERRPASSRLADLTPDASEAATRAIADILRAGERTGMLAISTVPVQCATRLEARPKLWPLAALDAEEGEHSATLRHSAFLFAPLQRMLAPLIDGTRTLDDLTAAAVRMAGDGRLTVNGPDGPVADPRQLAEILQDAVKSAVTGLLSNGLLVET